MAIAKEWSSGLRLSTIDLRRTEVRTSFFRPDLCPMRRDIILNSTASRSLIHSFTSMQNTLRQKRIYTKPNSTPEDSLLQISTRIQRRMSIQPVLRSSKAMRNNTLHNSLWNRMDAHCSFILQEHHISNPNSSRMYSTLGSTAPPGAYQIIRQTSRQPLDRRIGSSITVPGSSITDSSLGLFC